ncbi:MAG TPA: 4Fe-4S dicluster domain-containing protein, partial [Thermomicrobiaceae bacterium]|nr:4Fe-4S dicluster domain-containing protein [Thermomicrobiaceae bacterium]
MVTITLSAEAFERSLDRCVQCGFCLPVCPTYRLFNDEESSPRGRIARLRAIVDGEVAANAATLQTYDECLGCRACEPACPAGVMYEDVFLAGREALAQTQTLPFDASALLWLIKSPTRLQVAARLWRLTGKVAVTIARFLPAKTPFALLAALPPPTPAGPASDSVTVQPQAVVHRGCLMDIFWARTNRRAAVLLSAAGIPAAELSAAAGCCGALHAHQGDRDTARSLARRTIRAFESSGARTIVSLAGGCGAFMAEYPDLFAPDDPWRARAQR